MATVISVDWWGPVADASFTFTDGAVPIIQLGLGDTRVPTGIGNWDAAVWDDDNARWSGTEPSWWDVSCYAHEAEINRGRERTTDRFLAGTASVTLRNDDGWADMAGSPGSIGAVSLRPGRQVRIGIDVATIGIQWLFRGVIDRVTPDYDPAAEDVVKLDCIDMLGEVGSTKLTGTGPDGHDDTFTERINRLLDLTGWPVEKRILADSPIRLVGTSYGAQAIDLLGVAADSVGGIVFSDEEGNIVTKTFGWQSYEEDDQPNGAIGNFVEGLPSTPAITPEPYLVPLGPPVTTVSTPDASSLTLPGSFTIFTTVRQSITGTGVVFLAGQWATLGQLEWQITRNLPNGVWALKLSVSGTVLTTSTPFSNVSTPPTGADESWALSVILNDGLGQSRLRAFRLYGDSWRPVDAGVAVPALTWVNRSSAIVIGDAVLAGSGAASTWPGRIYDVELAASSTPSPKGATIWRADISEHTAAATSWTDARARTWTVSSGGAANLLHPPTVPGTPGVIGDVCPAGWEVSFDRMDIATRVELNRELPEVPDELVFNFSASTALPPASGEIRITTTDQTLPTQMYVHVTPAFGTNPTPYLRNLRNFDEVTISDRTDTQNQTRTYRVTGDAFLHSSGTYWIIPITWIDGEVGVGGQVTLGLRLLPLEPVVVDDPAGQSLYGIETFELTDLISIDDSLFADLAERALVTRGYTSMPRLESVTLDAKAARGDMTALEMMATCRPELPSRYLCRLRLEDGRVVFDRNMFAVSTRHFISHNEWTLLMGLDDAYGEMHHILWDSDALWDSPTTIDMWS